MTTTQPQQPIDDYCKNLIKKWLELDDSIKLFNKDVLELKKKAQPAIEERDVVEKEIAKYLKEHSITDAINFGSGSIQLSVSTRAKPINTETIESSLNEGLQGDASKVKMLLDLINSNRQVTQVEKLKRKKK